MRKTVKRTFVTGLVIALPVLITLWVVRFFFNQIDAAMTPWVLRAIRLSGWGTFAEEAWIGFVAPVASVVLSLVLIWLLGLVGGNVIGRQILHSFERLVLQVPLVRGIYSATRQFLDTFSRDSRAFRKVVLIEYPRKGLWTMALLTNDTRGEVQARTASHLVSVFVPTTPNPTSGWLLFVAREEVVELDMSVDDAFKMIVSGGVLTPTFPHQPTGATPSGVRRVS